MPISFGLDLRVLVDALDCHHVVLEVGKSPDSPVEAKCNVQSVRYGQSYLTACERAFRKDSQQSGEEYDGIGQELEADRQPAVGNSARVVTHLIGVHTIVRHFDESIFGAIRSNGGHTVYSLTKVRVNRRSGDRLQSMDI